jgi:cytochrome c oxidase subunit 2
VQKFWSVLFGATMSGALLLFIVSPFVGWWLPKNVATFGAGIDNLFFLILGITGFFFVLTEAILVVAMWKFVRLPGRKASYTHGNHKLEIIWTIVPGVILFLLAVVQINVWAEVKYIKNMPKPDGSTQQMEVLARQWEWRVRYPSRDRMQSWKAKPDMALDFGTSPHIDDVRLSNEIHIWKGVKVLVHLKTEDVLHSFFLPNLRLKQDALPGKSIPVWFAVTEANVEKKGDRWVEKANDPSMIWELACAEFCGTRHSMMRGRLLVHETEQDFLDWLALAEAEDSRREPAGAPAKVAAR